MVDLNNFAIQSSSEKNSKEILEYLSKYTTVNTNGFSGNAPGYSYYYKKPYHELNWSRSTSNFYPETPIYTLQEFIRLYENYTKIYELW